MTTASDVLAEICRMVCEMSNCDRSVVGEHTRFFADLGLGSIDAIVLGEKLEEHYGRVLGFAEGLAAWAQRGHDDVSLAELAAFVQLQLATEAQER